ncbi:hypothetical protein MMC22_007128 [Lobaria immixta]|nr:hypothetical protein [Lobaria immixta]
MDGLTVWVNHKSLEAPNIFGVCEAVLKAVQAKHTDASLVLNSVTPGGKHATVIRELPQLSSESESEFSTGEEEAKEAASIRHIEAFDNAALVALHLSKKVLGAMGKGDKIPSRGEVSALRKMYDEARQMLDGARKAVGNETMDMIEAVRASRVEV